MTTLTGARWLAAALAGAGVDQVFFVDAILRRTLIELETSGVRWDVPAADPIAVDVVTDPWPRAPEPWIPPL